MAAFSQRGERARRVDLVAPGTCVIGLRDPGSMADGLQSEAPLGERFFRGSGTSRAVRGRLGAAALLIGKPAVAHAGHGEGRPAAVGGRDAGG